MMLAVAVLVKLLFAGLVTVLLALLVFFYAWAERQFLARSQQRHGVSLSKARGVSVVAADFVKLLFKDNSSGTTGRNFLVSISIFLPVLFFIYLFQAFGQIDGGRGEVFLLFFILGMSLWTQKVLVFSPIEERERFSFDHSHVLLLMAMAALFLSLLPTVLITGSGSLTAIDRFQEKFPFILMLHSPGTFLAALTSFVSLLLLLRLGAAGPESGQFLNGTKGQSFFWIQRLWIVCMVSLWVYVNLGGGPLGLIDFFSFILRVVVVLCLFLWVHVSLPRGRTTDLSHFVLRALVPLALIAVMAELVWISGPGRSG